jgi:hypothetical protein
MWGARCKGRISDSPLWGQDPCRGWYETTNRINDCTQLKWGATTRPLNFARQTVRPGLRRGTWNGSGRQFPVLWHRCCRASYADSRTLAPLKAKAEGKTVAARSAAKLAKALTALETYVSGLADLIIDYASARLDD